MADQTLPDGSEKGLSGHNIERMPRRRVGLAPPAGVIDRQAPYKRIATEEAWTFPALVRAQLDYLASADVPDDAALRMGGTFAANRNLQRMLQDLGELRIAHMDEYGIDRQLLLLTAPGVQVLRPGEGTALAREANDIAADACRRYPERFSACAAFDPRDVRGSVREIERAMTGLKLNGAVLNSHFQGRYIDEPEFEPIVEALAAHDAALYIHPTAPWHFKPYGDRGFFGALGGFPHDVWLHTMGIVFSGLFDRYPGFRLVIGHMGESMPLQLYRFDWMQGNCRRDAGTSWRSACGETREDRQRLFPQQHLDHHQRRRLGAGRQVLHGTARARASAVRHGLSLPAVLRRGRHLRPDEPEPRAQEDADAD